MNEIETLATAAIIAGGGLIYSLYGILMKPKEESFSFPRLLVTLGLTVIGSIILAYTKFKDTPLAIENVEDYLVWGTMATFALLKFTQKLGYKPE